MAFCLVLSSFFVIGLGLTFILIVSLGAHREALFAWSDLPRLLIGSLFAPPLLAFAALDERARRRGKADGGSPRSRHEGYRPGCSERAATRRCPPDPICRR